MFFRGLNNKYNTCNNLYNIEVLQYTIGKRFMVFGTKINN